MYNTHSFFMGVTFLSSVQMENNPILQLQSRITCCIWVRMILFPSSPTIYMIYTSHRVTLPVSTYSTVKWDYTVSLVGFKLMIFRDFDLFQPILNGMLGIRAQGRDQSTHL